MVQDYTNSCRFCLNFIKSSKRNQITDEIREQYKEAVNVDLSKSELFPEFHCKKCYGELQTCLEIKKKFVRNQKTLEENYNIKLEAEEDKKDENILNFVNIKVEADEISVGSDQILENDFQTLIKDNKYESDQKFQFAVGSKNSKEKAQKTDRKKKIKERKKPKKYNFTKRINCEECGAVLRNALLLQKHINRVHLKLREYICDLDGKGFRCKSDLERHIQTHQKSKNHLCVQCGSRFHMRIRLIEHIRKDHESRYEKTCEYCGKICKTTTYLKLHISLMHTEEKDKMYHCSFDGCKKRFVTNNAKINHEAHYKHTEEICPICSTQVKYLSMHMLTHKLKYVCDLMGTDGESVCNKKFSTRSLLNHHIQVRHKGLKKFVCTFCDAAFTTKPVLQNHIKNIHEQKRIKCELCSSLFTRRDYYRKHVRQAHQDLDHVLKEELLKKIQKSNIEDLFNHDKPEN